MDKNSKHMLISVLSEKSLLFLEKKSFPKYLSKQVNSFNYSTSDTQMYNTCQALCSLPSF